MGMMVEMENVGLGVKVDETLCGALVTIIRLMSLGNEVEVMQSNIWEYS